MNRGGRYHIHPSRLHGKAAVAVDCLPPELVTVFIVAQAAVYGIGKGIGFALVGGGREIPVDDVAGALIGNGEGIGLFAAVRQAIAVAAAVGQGPVIDRIDIACGDCAKAGR